MLWKGLALACLASLIGGATRAADASSVDDSGVVTLRAGEIFEIVFPDRNDLTHPKFSRTLDRFDDSVTGFHPPRPDDPPAGGPALLSFEFKKGVSSYTLQIRNDTGVGIKYDANMAIGAAGGERTVYTSSCPVFPGMLGHELWMEPIVTLKLSNFRKIDFNGQFSCS